MSPRASSNQFSRGMLIATGITSFAIWLLCSDVLARETDLPTDDQAVTAQIQIIKKLPKSGDDTRIGTEKDYVASHMALIKSPLIVEKAIDAHLKALPELAGRKDLASDIIKGLVVRRNVQQAPLVEIALTGFSSELGTKILSAVIESYRSFLDETYRHMSDDTLKLISTARAHMEQELTRLKEEQRQALHRGPVEISDTTKSRLAAFEAKRTAQQLKRAEIEGRLQSIEESVSKNRGMVALAVQAREWATKSGFDKLPAALRSGVDELTAFRQSLSNELEETIKIEEQVAKLIDRENATLGQEMIERLKRFWTEENLNRSKSLAEGLDRRLQSVKVNRNQVLEVKVISPPAARQ